MHNPHILCAVVALAFWTFCVLLVVPVVRFRAAFRGEVTPGDFRYGESNRVPPDVSLPNRNYANLLESPVLFYVVCLLLYATNGAGYAAIVAAWIYVALRVIHSFVHMTYNNVFHRLSVFSASIVVLIFLWVVAAVHVLDLVGAWHSL